MPRYDLPPNGRNFFQPLQSELVVRRLPDVEFFCQQVTLPGISSRPAIQHNPLVPIPHTPDVADFSPLQVTFIVDEWLANYSSVFDWVVRLTFPESSEQYASIAEPSLQLTGEGVRSDLSIFMRDSKGRARIEVILHDAFPVSISDVVLDSRDTTTQFMTATATFYYTRYEMIRTRESPITG